jgi:eukaryotic-like serine/threonine-protein kinase
MTAVLQPGSALQLGRFHLLRELGRGAQARVWLAHDPRLDREVALKLLSADADAQTRAEWLNEARAVSRLTHPHVVPVFEADEEDGQSYLVFEYVQGPTLYEQRRTRPSLPPREAVQLLIGVLDALAAAHAQGIVHRDLKPSNVLLGHDGRPRVMDFGIAARVSQGAAFDAAQGRIVGTPGYMSPEAARGEPPQPQMDVFSAGVMLGELLAGAPLLRETDPWRAVARVQKEDLVLPAQVKVDDTLRGIVQRALARETAARYDSARSMRDALAAWLAPKEAPVAADAGSDATLQFLLRRMRHKSDFPALSKSVVSIQRLALSETERSSALTDEILKDVALTNKLLRMVNTVHFTSVAGGGISTVSRAVALVGFAGIRNMALSVILLEHMKDKGHAAQMKEEFLRALMSGTLAGELTPLARESEEAFLAAMFQNLGRLLTEYYFQEEALQIRQALASQPQATPLQRDAAARKVLGIGFDDLGGGVAAAWGLPDNLQKALRLPAGDVPAKAIDRKADGGTERLRWLARGANALTDAMLGADGAEQAQALAAAADSFAPALGLQPRQLVATALDARKTLANLAAAMNLSVGADAPARRLLQDTEAPAAASAAASAASAVSGHARPAAAGRDDRTLVTPPAHAGAAQQQLADGLNRVRAAVAQRSLPLNELLRLLLQTLHGALGLQRVVLCIRDPRGSALLGRVGVGERAQDSAAEFRIVPDERATGDLFAAITAKGVDLLVADAGAMAKRLPAWYRQRVNAPTFLLLPMVIKSAPIGLIYADKGEAGSLKVGEAELALLRGLRDEAVTALTQSGQGAQGGR